MFDLQTAVAESFGYRATKAQRPSEVLMHRYYWAAKAVTQLNQILLQNIAERVSHSEAAPMRPIIDWAAPSSSEAHAPGRPMHTRATNPSTTWRRLPVSVLRTSPRRSTAAIEGRAPSRCAPAPRR